jgi:hypothetical protein
MKTIFWILILSILFTFIFRFVRKVLKIKKAFKEAINQGQQFSGQQQNYERDYKAGNQNNISDNSKYNIEAETIDFEIIDDKHEK